MLFLATWPNSVFTLVRAASKDEALLMLDQFADPACARVEPYDRPLCFSFRISSDEKAEFPVGQGGPDGDEGVELIDAALQQGYPHTYEYYHAVWTGEKKPAQSEVEAAMHLDQEMLQEELPEPPDVNWQTVQEEFERVFGNGI